MPRFRLNKYHGVAEAAIQNERDEAIKEFNRAAHDVNNPNKTPEKHAAEMLAARKEIKKYNFTLDGLKRIKEASKHPNGCDCSICTD